MFFWIASTKIEPYLRLPSSLNIALNLEFGTGTSLHATLEGSALIISRMQKYGGPCFVRGKVTVLYTTYRNVSVFA